jgi:tetratricopeptide (TPR) repeat protein
MRHVPGFDYYGLMLLSRHFVAVALAAVLVVQAQAADAPDETPASSALDGELFYQLLLGELSAQGSDPGTGYALILDAARKTGDPRLYQRAVDIALKARSGDSALQAARAWKQALPQSKDANRYVLQILIGLNRTSEVLEPLRRDIAMTEPRERAAAISHVPSYFARVSDKARAASVVEQALADYLGNGGGTGVAAWITVGRMRLEAGDAAAALEAAQRAQAIDPNAEGPALLALSMLGSPQAPAESVVRKYLDGKPQTEVRMAYARALLDAQRYAEASDQIRIITTDKPDYAEAWLIQGTLELQDKRLAAAEKSIKRYVAMVQSKRNGNSSEQHRGLVQAYLSLAQIAEERQDFAAAESWLNKITSTQDMIRTQSRRAGILARQGRLDEARRLIRGLPEQSPADARQKLTAEIQLLRDNKQYKAAYELLAQATSRDPKDIDLLYDQATLAEKLGNTDEMERLLRRIIAEKPDYHHAYNALGYSLADRNIRLAEARQLILKALEFAPGDPFISDSLGWVEFRSGNAAEALRILQAAFKSRPDAEIAAHLGEVMWSLGKREQAMGVWKEGLGLNADNETLLETLKRLRVKP